MALAAFALAAFALAGLEASPAKAQSAPPESVQSRPRPEFEPSGIALYDLAGSIFRTAPSDAADRGLIDSMILFPSFEIAAEFDNNIYRTPADTRHDYIVNYRPGLTLRSDWDNHALTLALVGDLGRYDTYSGENYDDAAATAEGRVDIEEFWTLAPSLSYRRGHEARGSPDDPGIGTEPTTYDLYGVGLSSTYQRDAWILRPTLRRDVSDFHDAGPIDNDDRDRTVTSASFRVGFEFSPETILYAEPSYNWVRYAQDLDNFGIRRDSQGQQGLVGLTWDFSGVTYFDLAAGYARQRYDDPTLDTISGSTFRAGILWNATGLVTVSLNGARNIRETTFPGAAGVFETTLAGRIDYEALDNLLVDLRAGWQTDEFKGLQRQDDILRLSIGATYLVGRNLRIGISLHHDTRSSNAAGADYEDFRGQIKIGARF